MSEVSEGFFEPGTGVLVSFHDGEQVGGRVLGVVEGAVCITATVKREARGLRESTPELVKYFAEIAEGWSRARLVGSHVLRGDLYGARMPRAWQVMSEGRFRAFQHMVEISDELILVNVHPVRTLIDTSSIKLIELWEDVNEGRVLAGLDFEVGSGVLEDLDSDSDVEDADVPGS